MTNTNDYGKVIFEGKTYQLTSEADFDYRSDKLEPNNYVSAYATLDGKEYKVYWYVDDPTAEMDSREFTDWESPVEVVAI